MPTLNVTQAKARLTELVRRADKTYESVVITRNGRPKAVLMSYDELQGLLKTLEIMKDKTLVRDIARGMKDAEAGRVIPFHEIRRTG
jgi:antitoxin YefM